MSLEEQIAVLSGVVSALRYVLSADQREDVIRLLRTSADSESTPPRAAIVLRRLADAMKTASPQPTQH